MILVVVWRVYPGVAAFPTLQAPLATVDRHRAVTSHVDNKLPALMGTALWHSGTWQGLTHKIRLTFLATVEQTEYGQENCRNKTRKKYLFSCPEGLGFVRQRLMNGDCGKPWDEERPCERKFGNTETTTSYRFFIAFFVLF